MDINRIKTRSDFCKPIVTNDFILCKNTLKSREEYTIDYKTAKNHEIATIAFLVSDKSAVELFLYNSENILKKSYIKSTNESFDFQNDILLNKNDSSKNGKLIIKNIYQTEASWLTFNAIDKIKNWKAGLINYNQDLIFDKYGYISMAYGFIKINNRVIRNRHDYINIIPGQKYSVVVDFNNIQIDEDFIGNEDTCGIGIWMTYE